MRVFTVIYLKKPHTHAVVLITIILYILKNRV